MASKCILRKSIDRKKHMQTMSSFGFLFAGDFFFSFCRVFDENLMLL